jgi:hypothetical protein
LQRAECGASEAIQLPHHDDVRAPPRRRLEQLPPSAPTAEVRGAGKVNVLAHDLVGRPDRRAHLSQLRLRILFFMPRGHASIESDPHAVLRVTAAATATQADNGTW